MNHLLGSRTHKSPLLNVMIQAVYKAARNLTRDFGEVENLQISKKGPGDFVSNADLKADRILRKELEKARPEFGFLTEEGSPVIGTDAASRWIIDPLDGTSNFLHGLPHFAISVALEQQGEIIAGVIYDPLKNDLFCAEKGTGAFCNDKRIRVSLKQSAEDCFLATGLTLGKEGSHTQALKDLSHLQGRGIGIRMWGSASLDLAYVAAARLDGYWQEGLKPWDVAAGILIIKEAGGYVVDRSGKSFTLESSSLISGPPILVRNLLKVLNG